METDGLSGGAGVTPLAPVPVGREYGTYRTAAPVHAAVACACQTREEGREGGTRVVIARGQQPTHLPAYVGTNVPILEVGGWDQTEYRVACTQETEINFPSLSLSVCMCYH